MSPENIVDLYFLTYRCQKSGLKDLDSKKIAKREYF
jgi:hypothetical protein